MTILTSFSLYLMYKSVGFMTGAPVVLAEFTAARATLGYILACVVIYLIFSFVVTVFQHSMHYRT